MPKPTSITEPDSRNKKRRKDNRSTTATQEPCDVPGATTQGHYVQSPELSSVPQATIDQYLHSNEIQVTDPSGESPMRPITSFTYLPPVSSKFYTPLRHFSEPSPIQSASWPLLYAGRDVIGVAETGCGKTLAFGLPCLRKVHGLKKTKPSSHIHAVIITPTRELANQVYEQLMQFGPSIGIGITCIYGGVSKDEQRKALRETSVIVATPGRLKDLQNEQSVDLSHVQYLVLDEADRMLDKGFEQDIRDIISTMPLKENRQTAMFTATWPATVRNLATSFTTLPVTIGVGQSLSSDLRANYKIKQIVEVLKPHEKQPRLLKLLQKYQSGTKNKDRILLFCLYKKEAVRLEQSLRSAGFTVAGIHGDLNQSQRFQSLQAFKSGSTPLLVATDVAARGLDIPSVKLVINVTFPLTIEDYVHRIGR